MSAEFAISISIVPFLAAGLVTPGYIIMYVLSRFTTGRPSFASSLAVSSAYYVGVWAVFGLGSAVDVAQRIRAFRHRPLGVALTVVVAPLGIGVLTRVSLQRGWLYDALRKVGLEPVHGIPSAWDWKFMRAKDQWSAHLGFSVSVRWCRYATSNSDLHRAAQRGGMLHPQGHRFGITATYRLARTVTVFGRFGRFPEVLLPFDKHIVFGV